MVCFLGVSRGKSFKIAPRGLDFSGLEVQLFRAVTVFFF